MVDISEQLNRPGAWPVTLLFGPLALNFDSTAFAEIRRSIINNDNHTWIMEVLSQLPQQWKTITTAIPSLYQSTGLGQIQDLADVLLSEQELATAFPLPNKMLIPLIVISHLIQYTTFLEQTRIELDNRADAFAGKKANQETLGFCTGILSAIAVSSTESREQFIQYGAVAVRLAMLVGMVVDAQDAKSDASPSRSLSVAWNTTTGHEEVLRILEEVPEVRDPASLNLAPCRGNNTWADIYFCQL